MFVAYYRVSTARQGQSGLGLEAQQAAVAAFCQPVESYTEVETGTNKRQRPELQKALAACKRLGATLVVAKLDRLSRNVAFTAALMESGVEFIACDNPNANRLTVHILAAVAQDEAERISERTRVALAAAKARGVRLGNPNLTREASQKGSEANAAAAARHRADVVGIARKLRESGRSLREIARDLTGRGLLTRRGCAWSATAVGRLLA